MNKNELQKKVAEVASTIGSDPIRGRSAFAELIIELINPNHLTYELVNLFMNTRQLKPGDILSKRVRTGFNVRTMVNGTNHLADQIAFNDVMTYALDSIIAKTKWNLMQLQSGELPTVEEFRSELEKTLIDEVVSRVFGLLTTVWDGTLTSSNYYDASATGLTNTILDNAIETVIARGGAARTIVGSRAALLPVYAFAGYQEVTISGTTTPLGVEAIMGDYLRTGRVSVYKGVQLVELPQVFKQVKGALETKMIPDTSVLVLGENAGEAILYGDVQFQEATNLAVEPPDYTMAVWQQFGMIVDRPERICVIRVATSTAPYEI